MHFHVLGIGAIGSLLSYHLRRSIPLKHSVTLIHKTRRQAREIQEKGGSITVEHDGILIPASGFRSEVFEADDNIPKAAYTSTPKDTPVSRPYRIESLFVTTKAHQTLPAIRRLLPRLTANTTIVLLQNGMGIYEQLIEEVFRNPQQRPHFILASNTHGAFRKSFYHVVHAGIGTIEFAIVPDVNGRDFEVGFKNSNVPLTERCLRVDDITKPLEDPDYRRYRSLRHTVAALLLLDGLSVSWKPIAQIQVAMRRKLVINAVINPLTALMGCRNGDIFTTEASRRIMRRVCQEASDAYAAQLRTETQSWLDQSASEYVDMEELPVGRLPRPLTRPALEAECLRVAEITKGNVSSMLSDIRRGAPTEIEFMNGYLLGLGSAYRVEMPANAMLLNLVKMRTAIPLDQIL